MNGRRLAVITGSAGGLGAAFARHLASEGYDLLLTDSDSSRLTILADELNGNGTRVRLFAADLANERDVDRLVEAISLEEDIQLLINNAGFGLVCKFQSVEINRVIDMVRVHITASLRLIRAVLPNMIKAGNNAAIVNVASAGAFTRFPRDASYIASKAYMIAFTECLALDLVGTHVNVQALCPAWIATEFTRGAELAKIGYTSPIPKWLFSSPESVVESSLNALRRGQVTHIPSVRARIAIWLIGSAPGQWVLSQLRNRGMGSSPMPGD
jgi:uncharacterized protein